MIEKITDTELDFVDIYHYSPAMVEMLFSDYDNLSVMEEEKLAHVRLGQLPLLSYEYIIDSNPEMNDKDNFQLRKGAGEIYCLGGRLFGKTLFVEKTDLLLSLILLEGDSLGFSSYDQIHIRGVLEEVIQVIEHHPFFRIFNININRSPNYRIRCGGILLESVNMNITGKKPGAQFFQKHFSKLFIEEASFETEQVYKQRRDSVSENGCVYRISGMTNFTKYSPCGRLFYDLTKRAWVLNLPQYINPKCDEREKEKAKKDFGGEQSVGYRIFIKGEIVEEGVSVFDMERIRPHYDEDKKVKTFEISKDTFPLFDISMYVERPVNAENIYIFADVGEAAPTEIGVIAEINRKYRYIYNLTLYNLTDKEQYRVFRWLAEMLQANFIAIDCTDGMGRAIYRSLAEVFPADNLVWVSFNEKIPIDFEKDKNGNVIIKNGVPVYKEEYVSEWSVKHLKDLLYSGKIELPLDYKFDMQFNSVISMQSGSRTVYACISAENHLFQAFQVFSIAQWYNEFKNIRPIPKKTFFKSGI